MSPCDFGFLTMTIYRLASTWCSCAKRPDTTTAESPPQPAWQALVPRVKYGPNVTTMPKALTQDELHRTLLTSLGSTTRQRAPTGLGYIVVKYIDAPDCTMAQAVQTLISVKGPSSAPGPVGGGFVSCTHLRRRPGLLSWTRLSKSCSSI
jgi:hypothetical protein